MKSFPPINPAWARKPPENHESRSYRNIGRRSIYYLEAMDSICQPDQFENSWGYAIFRTDYSSGSNERFSKALKLLDTYAGNWLFDDLNHKPLPGNPPLDPRVMYEVRSRYYNITVEDQATSEDATIDEVGRQFDKWVELQEDDSPHHSSPRLQYCIMLDKESINNILTLRKQPDQVQYPDVYYSWVKVLSNELRDGRRAWLRVAVFDVLWEHWFAFAGGDLGFDEILGDYPEDGVLNLYGPPCPFPIFFQPDETFPTPTDSRPGHPERKLEVFPYTRLEPRK